jgi:small GTP-binding protein
VPRFAVVGRVNKGKSSIVATLAEDDSVRVGPRPGTTTECREYPVRVDGKTLFVLVDTPGFEDAPRALEWLRSRETTAAERPARVAELVRAHHGTDAFVEERRLLQPILDGASILYVVDGTRPFRPNYEAEMEILRWTGRPGMALVNRIGSGDHSAEWHRALDQYFRIVRDFDAFAVRFEERLALLGAFRELRPDWRRSIDEALGALGAQRERRRREAALEVADLLVDGLTHVEELTLPPGREPTEERDRLERSFHEALRVREQRARRRVEALFAHRVVRLEEEELARPVFEQDLFAEESWRMLGLSPGQAVAAGALAGAGVGGSIDAVVGGASVMAGALLGGAIGAGTALYGLGRRHARVRQVGADALDGLRRSLSRGTRWRIGPHAQPNFPWVLLDRALLHYRAVDALTHARRGAVPIEGAGKGGLVAGLSREERRRLGASFQSLRRQWRDPPREVRDALSRALLPILERIEGTHAG